MMRGSASRGAGWAASLVSSAVEPTNSGAGLRWADRRLAGAAGRREFGSCVDHPTLSGLFTGSAGLATFRGSAAAARELAGALVGDSKDCAEFANG